MMHLNLGPIRARRDLAQVEIWAKLMSFVRRYFESDKYIFSLLLRDHAIIDSRGRDASTILHMSSQ